MSALVRWYMRLPDGDSAVGMMAFSTAVAWYVLHFWLLQPDVLPLLLP